MKFILVAVVAIISSSNAILLHKNENEDPVAAAAYHAGAGYKPIAALPTCNFQNNTNCIVR